MNKNNIILSPSLLSCDFAFVQKQLEELDSCGISAVHLDVMDGIFVPNISFGIPVIKSIRKHTKLFFDTHLMITKPERYIKQFASAGSDCITIHYEATENPLEVLKAIKAEGVKAGISVKPGTNGEAIFDLLPYCDLVLVMTVEPGFGGQSFMSDMMPKVRAIRNELDRINSKAYLSVDGGIDENTVKTAYEAGADMFVAGSAVFGKPDIKKAVDGIMSNIKQHMQGESTLN